VTKSFYHKIIKIKYNKTA